MNEATKQAEERTLGQMLKLVRELANQALAIPPVFIDIAGSILAGLLLAQLIYWTRKNEEREGEDFGAVDWSEKTGWFFVRAPKLQASLRMGKHEMETARRALREKGFLEEAVKGIPPTLWVRVEMPKVLEAVNRQLSEDRKINYQKTRKSILRKPENQLSGDREDNFPAGGESSGGKPENYLPVFRKTIKDEDTNTFNTNQSDKKSSLRPSARIKKLSTADGIHYSRWASKMEAEERDWSRRNPEAMEMPGQAWARLAEIAARRAGVPVDALRRILNHETPDDPNIALIGQQPTLAEDEIEQQMELGTE